MLFLAFVCLFVCSFTVCSNPREGVIIEWPLNGQFNNACDIILTSRIDVREMEDNDNDNEMLIFTVFWLKMKAFYCHF